MIDDVEELYYRRAKCMEESMIDDGEESHQEEYRIDDQVESIYKKNKVFVNSHWHLGNSKEEKQCTYVCLGFLSSNYIHEGTFEY